MSMTPDLIAQGMEAAAAPLIHRESHWQQIPHDARARVPVSRWVSTESTTVQGFAEVPINQHLLALILRPMRLRFVVDGQALLDGRALPGAVQIGAPGQHQQARFEGPCDVLHLHLGNDLLRECLGEARGALSHAPLRLRDPGFAMDPAIDRLGRALLAAESMDAAFGRLYVDAVGLAVISHLLHRYAGSGQAGVPRRSTALQPWRLTRALDYIEAHLGENIALAELAEAAGLTRMHFAAQFRAATGLRPHEYLLRRRIERAQELLRREPISLADVALSVGFQTQAHFTTVFKRFVGRTPHRWWQDQRIAA
ncbi:MAG: AraC family transcriptional regulator [Dyella sp.]